MTIEGRIYAPLAFKKLRNQIICNICFNDTSNEKSLSLLQLAVSNSIQRAFTSSSQAETLSGDDSSFQAETLSGGDSICCNFCCFLKLSSVVPAFLEEHHYLVIQLMYLVSHNNQVIKDKTCSCTPNFSMPFKDNEVAYQKDYHLIAPISHTGNLNRGHYTSFIKIPNSKSWLHCNDAVVHSANENKVNNTNHINFFFLISLSHETWISFLVFWCENLIYNPSPCAFCFVKVIGYLSLSLGVMMLHITPVTIPFMVKMLLHWWWFAVNYPVCREHTGYREHMLEFNGFLSRFLLWQLTTMFLLSSKLECCIDSKIIKYVNHLISKN